MSASSSDSWILIALTFLVVLLLFYLSKKMICNSYGSSSSEDSPTTTPSSSTTSTSTSYSDNFYGGYNGRSPLDLRDAAGVTTTSYGSSPQTDDLAIDIADSLSYPSDYNQTQHYHLDNQCPSNNNGNNYHSINNFHRSHSVMRNGRRISCGNNGGSGRGVSSATARNDNNNREMDFGGLPPTSSVLPATTTGSPQPILLPISIIASAALDRKTMLEIQLRNQIAKIVQAEREIQRLVQMLSLEQRQGWNAETNNMLAAARASLLQHHRRYPQVYHHLRGLIPPPIISTLTNTSSTSPSTGSATQPIEDHPAVETDTHIVDNNRNSKNNDIPSLSVESVSANEHTTSAVDADNHGDNDHYNTTQTTSQGNYHHLCHSHAPHYENENSQSFSDLLMNSNLQQNSTPPHQQMLSCGREASSIASFPQHNCTCTLCNMGNSTTRACRMLMLRRMLLPISSYPIATNVNVTSTEAATRLHGDFLARSLDPLASDLNYPREEQQHRRWQPVPAPQSGFSDYSHQYQRDNYDHHQQEHRPDDDPPPYEQCIRSGDRTTCDSGSVEQDQNLYNNGRCGSNGQEENQAEQAVVAEAYNAPV